MEYVQTTIDDWIKMKEQLKSELMGVQASFVSIGYLLRQIDEQKLYEQDGYKTITEFAKTEYNLSASTVSRFIAINKRYSVDGNSKYIDPRYANIGSSKLAEMLALPDGDLQMINEDTQRSDIRELKSFNNADPVEGVADAIREVILSFLEVNKDMVNDFYSSEAYETGEISEMIEIINPAGTRSYKKGLYFMLMYESDIKVKKYGTDPISMSWSDFFAIMNGIFEGCIDGTRTYGNYFGEPEPEPKPEEKPEEKQAEKSTKTSATTKAEKPVAPAQKEPQKTEDKDLEKVEKVEGEVVETASEAVTKTVYARIKNMSLEKLAVELATQVVIAHYEEVKTAEYWRDWLNSKEAL